jgi:hypothetical protein
VGAKREYTAIFAIGGRLLGSFRGAMAMAQARLRGLAAMAKRVGGLFKSMAIGMLAGFGTFLAADVLGKIFKGAQQEAIEAEQRTRALSNALMLNTHIAKGGTKEMEKQLGLIKLHNEKVEEQGVLHKDILDNMAVELAMRGGIPSGAIQDSIDVMQNLIVATHGVNATEEQGTAIARAWAAATAKGRLMGLSREGVRITKEQQKAFGKLTSVQARQHWLITNIGKQYRGVNTAARSTPVGRITLFTNAMKDLSNEIGDVLLPAQADMADAWREMLTDPEIRGMLIGSVRRLGKAISWAASIIKDDLIPVLAAVGESDAFKKLAGYARSFAKSVKEGFDLLGFVAKAGAPYDTTREAARKAFPGLPGPYLPTVSPMEKTLEPMRKLTGLDLFKPHVTPIQDFNVATSQIPGNTDRANKSMEVFKALGRDIVIGSTVLSPKMIDMAKNMTDQAESVEKAVTWWQALHELMLQMMATGTLGAGAQGLAAESLREREAAKAVLPAHQAGGIFTKPHIAQIAERGPEAVVPLSKAAAGRFMFPNSPKFEQPMSPKYINAPSLPTQHIYFEPKITINGNASEAEQAALDARLRDLARDFVADFKAAQNHERRLSYESGYG